MCVKHVYINKSLMLVVVDSQKIPFLLNFNQSWTNSHNLYDRSELKWFKWNSTFVEYFVYLWSHSARLKEKSQINFYGGNL